MLPRPSILALLGIAAGAFAIACGASSPALTAAEQDGKVFRCVPVGSGAQAEVFVNGSCIGTAYSSGLSDKCWTQPRVEEANPTLSTKSKPSAIVGSLRRYSGNLWGSFPNELGCSIHLTESPEREIYRQRLTFHPDFFPALSPDPLFKAVRLEQSPLQANEDETGWTFLYKGVEVTRLERAGLEQRSFREPIYRGQIGGYRDGAIDCSGIARIRHLRTLCSDPKKAVFGSVLDCGATVQLEGKARGEWQHGDGVTSREVTPYELSVGFARVHFEAVGPNTATVDLDYFRTTGQPPPSCSMQ